MAFAVFCKIFILSLCLSEMILATPASADPELFKTFFLAAQEFKKAAVEAGGIDKLKQDPNFKEVPPQIMDLVFVAGKALEELPNSDIAARDFLSTAKDIGNGIVETGKKAWQGVKSTCNFVADIQNTI